MIRLRHDEYLAVAVSRLHAESNSKITRLERWCFYSENNVYSYPVAMPLKLDFELIEQIDDVITNVMEFGLVDKWKKMSEGPSFRTLVAKALVKQHEEEHTSSNGTVVLTVDHIIGALIIMAIGYLSAIIAFLVEKCVHQKVQQRTKSKLVLSLHKFFSPNRIDSQVTDFYLNNL